MQRGGGLFVLAVGVHSVRLLLYCAIDVALLTHRHDRGCVRFEPSRRSALFLSDLELLLSCGPDA